MNTTSIAVEELEEGMEIMVGAFRSVIVTDVVHRDDGRVLIGLDDMEPALVKRGRTVTVAV